ncbi:hypothetical protein ACQX36_10370 [Corynebacterium diphtheriae]|uniref:hypothetical protein n=1 Tax=Corynebacterium diphtheriae TaxID=1717 RepID=UPI00159F02D2|nr:hypothetical protein [Corynebacterium diphtheriae]MBG9342439.1 hypothetical protein [Corynebacterium diphtheriae]MBN4651739.1 hypothetical protein [Corynebacterium diphtheriae bv. mitis]
MLGYYILPSQLFAVLATGAADNDNLNVDLKNAFNAVKESTAEAESADDFEGLFQDFAVAGAQADSPHAAG